MDSSSGWKSQTSSSLGGGSPPVATTSALAFLAFLNATVLNVAIPDVAGSFDSDVELASWTVTGYVALLAAGLTAGGRLADSAGRRRVLALGTAAFGLAALAGALAPSLEIAILARCVQGAAAALITPASFGLLLEATKLDRRARVIGAWSSAAATSAFVGPPCGGALVDLAGWRAPLALSAAGSLVLIVLVARLRLPRDAAESPRGLQGALVGGAGAAVLLLAATQAPQWGWADPRTAVAVVAGTGAIAFVLFGRGGAAGRLIDPELIRRRAFVVANALSFVFGFAAFSWLLAGPLFAAEVWGWDAMGAALSVAPGAVLAALAAWGAGRLPSHSRRWTIVAGGAGLAATMLILAGGIVQSPGLVPLWLPAGMLAGAAIGGALASLSAIVASSVPARHFAEGAGVNITARQLGGALGVAVVGSLAHAGDGADPSMYTGVWLVIGIGGALTALGAVALLRSAKADWPRPGRAPRAIRRQSSVRLEA